ncbi:MAG: hypothetical protein AAF789_09545 [Bacteroidota bacterium]
MHTTEAFTPLPVEEPLFAPDPSLEIEEELLSDELEPADNELLDPTSIIEEAPLEEEVEEDRELEEETTTTELGTENVLPAEEEEEDLSDIELTGEESQLIEGLTQAAEQSDRMVAQAEENDPETEEVRRRESTENLEEFENFVANPPVGENPTPQVDTSSLQSLTQSFGQQSPSNMAKAIPNVNEGIAVAVGADINTINDALPTLEQPTGLEPGSLGDQKSYVAPPVSELPDFEMSTGQVQEISLPETPEPVPANVTSSVSRPTSQKELIQAVGNVSAEVSVDTSMGERPTVPLEGESDLAQMDANERSTTSHLFANRTEEIQAFQIDFGENEVYPNIDTETISSEQSVMGLEELPSIESPREMLVMLPSDEALLNEDILAEVEEERNNALADNAVVQQEFEVAREQEVDSGMQQIREEEQLITEAQIGVREENRSAIQSYRDEQSAETQAVYEGYIGEVETERSGQDAEIDAQIREAETEADGLMDGGEAEAQRMEGEAQVRVENRRQRAEEEAQEESWFDRAVDAVTDFFESLKETIAGWIDDLRRAVRDLFERIKQQVVDLIETARGLIVSAIRSFGEALKRLSDFALSQFPGIRDRFNALIDQSMNWAESMVNRLAENLKTFAVNMLDAIASGIDRALVLFQQGLFLLLDVFEAIAIRALRMAEAFYEQVLYMINVLSTLVQFVALIQAANFLTLLWHFLGEKQRERAINFLLDKAIDLFDNAPDEFDRGFLWPIFVNLTVGFLYELKNMTMQIKMDMMDKIAGLLLSGAFWLNFIIGIFKGIWENIWGIIEGIWMLLRFIFYDLWVTLARVMELLADIAPDIVELIENFSNDVHAFVEQFMAQGEEKIRQLRENITIEKIRSFFEGLADEIRVKAQVMGARGAHQFKDFVLRDDAYAIIGENLGIVIGYLTVEILLLIFTAGIGTAIKWGLKGVKVAVRIAKIFRNVGRTGGMLSRVARLFSRGIRWLIRAVVKAAEKLAKFAKAVMQRFRRIFQNLQRKIDDIIARITGRRPRRRPHGDGDNDEARNLAIFNAFKTEVNVNLNQYRSRGISENRLRLLVRTARRKTAQRRRAIQFFTISEISNYRLRIRAKVNDVVVPRRVGTIKMNNEAIFEQYKEEVKENNQLNLHRQTGVSYNEAMQALRAPLNTNPRFQSIIRSPEVVKISRMRYNLRVTVRGASGSPLRRVTRRKRLPTGRSRGEAIPMIWYKPISIYNSIDLEAVEPFRAARWHTLAWVVRTGR